jgi:hypothetical protein
MHEIEDLPGMCAIGEIADHLDAVAGRGGE